jgi:peptidyl-prolyl cis-trans isomerase D
MAIIGKIRKQSGLAVIIVGVAIAAFVIGDFGKKRYKGTTDIGVVNSESIPYIDFNAEVEKNTEIQKENSGSEKFTDDQTYNVRQSTWNTMVRDLLLTNEYSELGLTVTPEELFDQIQGKNPHRFILQYFKDPKTGVYDPALVLNYLKQLDQMEPKNRTQWLNFEKAIKLDRQETKFNNLITKAYYIPTAFAKREFEMETRSARIRFMTPNYLEIPDSTVTLTDADYQKFYDQNKMFFYNEEESRDVDYVVFDVTASKTDREKTQQDVELLYKDFSTATDVVNMTNANSDKKFDTAFAKKGTFPGKMDSLLFASKPGTLIPPYEFNNTWYMAKLLDIQERPDSMKGSHILIGMQGFELGARAEKRTKEISRKVADSIMAVLKKNPEKLAEIARTFSDYPTAKDDAGDLKWFIDGDKNFAPFFDAGQNMKPGEMKVVETRIGYSVFRMETKTKPVKKIKAAVMARNIEPSNQTYQDTYAKASAFAGQYKTKAAFDTAAVKEKLNKRNASSVKEMDNYLLGLSSCREVVRWAYNENTKAGDVSPVFDLASQGKYVVAVLNKIYPKGTVPLDVVKSRIEASVKGMKKIDIITERLTKAAATTKDLYALASQFKTKVDTTVITMGEASRTQLGRENEVVGKIFSLPKGVVSGPIAGKFGSYMIILDDMIQPSPKEEFAQEKRNMEMMFQSQATSQIFEAIKKAADIKDNRVKFY